LAFKNYAILNCTNKTNEYGKYVIELCPEAQLRILNGRTIGDSVCRITYHNYIGASIDDYCICNSSFLQNIVSFNVGDFEPTFSDHCPIFVKILSRFSEKQLPNFLNDSVSIRNNGGKII
jgi:hypothetical protein